MHLSVLKNSSILSIARLAIASLVSLVALPKCGRIKACLNFKYPGFKFGSPFYTSNPTA